MSRAPTIKPCFELQERSRLPPPPRHVFYTSFRPFGNKPMHIFVHTNGIVPLTRIRYDRPMIEPITHGM